MDERFAQDPPEGPQGLHPKITDEEARRRARKVQALGAGWERRDTLFLLLIVAVTLLICWLEFYGPGVRIEEGGPVPAPSGTRRVR